MLTRTQKEKIVEGLVDKFKRHKVAVFTDFRGTSVGKAHGLRRSLKKDNAEYKVAKKTLFDLALEKVGIRFSTQKLEGEIGVAFGYGDETAPVKTVFKFGKENETLKILGGILGGRILNAAEALALAKLPPREILLGQLAYVLQSPLRGLAVVLQGNMRNLVVVLQKVKDNKVA